MSNVIYAYKKHSTGKIVYVGQTTYLKGRHAQHIKTDPFNINCREYNYPLSRGIRKYGAEEYELIILENNVPLELLNEREKYWIAYYDTYWNGYNQTIGGTTPIAPKYTDNDIQHVINMLQDESFKFQDIANKTGISLTHIYNINYGKRRRLPNIIYPIRPSTTKGTKGLKFSPDECKQIHDKILENNLTTKQLATLFNCSQGTICDINNGKIKAYRLEGYEYPLRKNSHSIGAKLMWQNK